MIWSWLPRVLRCMGNLMDVYALGAWREGISSSLRLLYPT